MANSMVEKHNAILGKMIEKFVFDSDNKYPIDIIIAWATNAKNSLHHYSFSPNQLVFGHSSSLKFSLVNNLHLMEDYRCELHRKQLNVILPSQKAFMESESNEKLHGAIPSMLQSQKKYI